MKRYLISSLVTFAAAFAMYFVTVIDTIDINSLTDGTIIALVFTGIRAGIKAILEGFIVWYNTK